QLGVGLDGAANDFLGIAEQVMDPGPDGLVHPVAAKLLRPAAEIAVALAGIHRPFVERAVTPAVLPREMVELLSAGAAAEQTGAQIGVGALAAAERLLRPHSQRGDAVEGLLVDQGWTREGALAPAADAEIGLVL